MTVRNQWRKRSRRAAIAATLPLWLLPLAAAADTNAANDYPTTARVDYVLGCMAANGQSRQIMEKCACSIDVVAAQMPYARYEQADVVLQMQQSMTADRIGLFRDPPEVKDLIEELRRAQAQANLQCF
jgi:hypothetical protein